MFDSSIHVLPFFMHGDGFILTEEDLKKYNGHHEISQLTFVDGTAEPKFEVVCTNTSVEDLKQWLRPTKISSDDVKRWKLNPTLRILMFKTQNEFSRNPEENKPSHRTLPGQTEVTPLPHRDEQLKTIKELFRHARLPLAALGAYLKSHVTFFSAPSYEVFGDEGVSGGLVSKYYCSGTSWSLTWNYFHSTRHTTAVLFFREGDGETRRSELLQEIKRLREHITHPLLLAYIKTQVSLVWTFNLLEQMNVQTFEIEKNVGLATWDFVLDREVQAWKDPQLSESESEENFAQNQRKAVERYAVLSGKLINIRFRLRTFSEQIQWMRRMNRVFLDSIIPQNDAGFLKRRKESEDLDTILDRMSDFNKVYLHDADTLMERLNQQMSSLSYLVNQRDSRIGLAIADINNELAWQGKNTNNAMVAIAIASFVFLPSTFIASVFDTPIFNWTPVEGEILVKEPFWIFWLTCGLTTGLLCGCWLVYTRKKRSFDRVKRKQERTKFRNMILKTPTWTSGPGSEQQLSGGGWFPTWTRRVGKPVDEEEGIGLGAVSTMSFDDRR